MSTTGPGNLTTFGDQKASGQVQPQLTGHCFSQCVCVCVCVHSVVSDSGTPWTVAHQVPLSLEFSRQEYWSGVSVPTPGDLPNPGIKPESLASLALAGIFFTTRAAWQALVSDSDLP